MENSNPPLFMTQDPSIGSNGAIHDTKKHLVIWHDPNIYSPAKARYIQIIKTICNVELFTDWEETLTYLNEARPVSCKVLTSEYNGELLVKEIFNMSNITSIYVFSDNQASLTWINQYHKVAQTENEFKVLLQKMSENIIENENPTSHIMTDQPNKEDQEEKGEEGEEEIEEIIIKASINEVIKLFVKESTVILYDPKADSPASRDRVIDLKAVCDVQTFTDWKEATKCLEATKTLFCQVIISDDNAQLLVNEIYHMETISYIYVLSDNNFSKSWTKNHKKVISMKNDSTSRSLTDKIKEATEKWRKKHSSLKRDLPSFAAIFDDMDRSEENYRHYYLKGLTNFKDRRQAKADFLELANALYGTKNDILHFKEFEQEYAEYDMKSILKWYTKESFFYKLTNNCLRISNLDSIQYCRLTLRDIEAAIKEKYMQQSRNFIGLLYRGTYMSDKEWESLQENTGKDIEMNGFLSSTKNRDVAISFCQEDCERKVFITINVPNAPAKDEQGFAEVKEYSDFPDEEEVLFNIRSRFTVLEAKKEKIDNHEIRHVILLYGAQAMRRFIILKNPKTQIELENTQISLCKLCQQQIRFDDDSILAINISSPREYICHSCLSKSKMSKSQPLVCLRPSAHHLSKPFYVRTDYTIIGSVQNQESLNVSFYGYTCQICKTSKSDGWYTCLGCKNGRISYCNRCVFNKTKENSNRCDMKGHKLIYEGNPFSFWFERMLKKDVHRLKYQEQESDGNAKHLNQAKVFIMTHNNKQGVEYYEKQLTTNSKRISQIERLDLYHDLGRAYQNLEQYQKAINYSSRALEICKVMFGEQHRRTAVLYNNLGKAYLNVREFQKARDYHFKALELRKKICGVKHSDTAISFNDLGLAYQSLGEYQKAIDYYSQSLEIYKKVSGDKHPDIAVSYNNLGIAYNSLGEYQKAKNYHLQSLEIRRDVFGHKHPDTAVSHNNLGSTYHILGEYQKAIDCFSLSLKIRKAVLGENHSDTAASYNNLGSVYKSLGEYQKATDHYSQSLRIRKAVSGDKHIDIAILYNNLGLAYKSLGEYQKAKDYHSEALEMCKAIFEDNQGTAVLYDNLGIAYQNLGEYQKAADNHILALEIRKKVCGDEHSDIAASFNDIGLAHESLGGYQEAIDSYSLSLEVYKKIFGDKHLIIAVSYSKLGSAYQSMKKYQKAIDYYSKSLEIFTKVSGDKHPDIAVLYNNLGIAYKNLRKYQTAINYHLQSLEIRRALFGDNHPDIAVSYNHLGLGHYSLEKYRNAIQYHFQALEIYKAISGDNDHGIAISYYNLGTAHQKLGEYKKAIDYHFQALRIKKEIYEDEHSDTATSLATCENLTIKMAISNFRKKC